MRTFILLPTIPARRAACEALLAALPHQSQVPDGLILCLDGFGDEPAPKGLGYLPFDRLVIRHPGASGGPGHRWRVALSLCGTMGGPADEDLLVSLDDDADLAEAPRFVQRLVEAAAQQGAAAAIGITPGGRRAPPGDLPYGPLILGCACGLAVRARDLAGLLALRDQIVSQGGPDALGARGDDQALVSAHLWLRNVPLVHAATGPLRFAVGTSQSAQWQARAARQRAAAPFAAPSVSAPWDQARQIARLTGWPFPHGA